MNTKYSVNSFTRGFTIVELLIVIVVIGILAALVLNTFSGVQAKARDTMRKNDLAQIKKSFLALDTVEGHMFYFGSGCGSVGNGNGWFNVGNGGSYPTSIHDCLKNSGYLTEDIADPSGTINCTIGTVCRAYMRYHCGSTGNERVYIYASLETLPQSSTAVDGTCSPSLDTSYGMNYYVQIK